MSDREQGDWVTNEACIDCGSSDNLSIYEKSDGSVDGYCQTPNCPTGQYKSNNKLAEDDYLCGEYNIEVIKKGSKRPDKKVSSTVVKRKAKSKIRPIITKEEKQQLRDNSTLKGNRYRGILDQTNKKLGIRTTFGDSGAVASRWYPVTQGKTEDKKSILVGYKQRVCATKQFYPTGRVSKECDLFNQWLCKGHGKYIIIVGGEEDVAAAVQMIEQYRNHRGYDKIAEIDVVSSIIGEGIVTQQCQNNYEFLDGYDNIILSMDKDEAGDKATQDLLTVLPFHKVKIMVQPDSCKDASDAVQNKLTKAWIRAFYDSKQPKLAGVVSGLDMMSAVIESISKQLIPLPRMLKPLEDMLCGGLPTGEIINILAASGIGKTTITNAFTLFWIFEAPYKCGVLSLEAGAGKFLTRLLSAYLGKNIARLKTPEEKLEYIEDNQDKCLDLFQDKEGNDRFCLVDDRGDLDNLGAVKSTIERMIKQGGCEIIIIDPIQDILDTLSNEDQASFVGWQKKIKARDDVTFINVNHTRKSGGGGKVGSKGGELTEEDMAGTSTIYKSGAVNIILTRDKTAEDVEDRNTTKVTLFKSRDAGDTGPAGYLFYDIDTAKLHNKEEWVNGNIEDFQ